MIKALIFLIVVSFAIIPHEVYACKPTQTITKKTHKRYTATPIPPKKVVKKRKSKR